MSAYTDALAARDAAIKARDAAQITATAAAKALTDAQAKADTATNALASAQSALAAAQAVLDKTPPDVKAKSLDGTTALPNSGSIVDQNGVTWTVSAAGKILRDGVAVPSSGGVQKLVYLYADGPGLRQFNGRDWWTQPLTYPAGSDGAGTLTSAPGTVTPPVVVPPIIIGAPDIAKGMAKVFFDDFGDGIDKNFTDRFLVFGGGTNYGWPNGTQDWFATYRGFAPDLKLPPTAEILANRQGVRLHTYDLTKLGKFGDPRLRITGNDGKPHDFRNIAGLLQTTKFQTKPGDLVLWEITFSAVPGSFGAAWCINGQMREIDGPEHLSMRPDELNFGVVRQGTGMGGGGAVRPGFKVGGARIVVGWKQYADKTEFYAGLPGQNPALLMTKPSAFLNDVPAYAAMNLVLNNVIGWWPDSAVNQADHSQVDFHNVTVWRTNG